MNEKTRCELTNGFNLVQKLELKYSSLNIKKNWYLSIWKKKYTFFIYKKSIRSQKKF